MHIITSERRFRDEHTGTVISVVTFKPVFRLSHNILLKIFPFFKKFFTLQSLELQAFYTLFRLFDKIFLWYNLTCEYCEYNFTG